MTELGPLTPRGELVRDLVALLVHVLAELELARARVAELEAGLEAMPAGIIHGPSSDRRGGGWRSDPWLAE